MALAALTGRRLVEHHFLALRFAIQFVTVITGDFAMRPFERKRRPFVMIELRWLPPPGIVAARTIGGILSSCELPRMRVDMATGALG